MPSKPVGPEGGLEPDEDGTTATLPKALFGDDIPEPGETITLKVARIHEDEIEVSRVRAEPEEEATESEMTDLMEY